jgi:hypothetical protein
VHKKDVSKESSSPSQRLGGTLEIHIFEIQAWLKRLNRERERREGLKRDGRY